jgi:hypothetical protein
VFIPSENVDSGGGWVGIDECVWSGPKCLEVTPRLEKYYPEHQSLPRDTLDLETLTSKPSYVRRGCEQAVLISALPNAFDSAP